MKKALAIALAVLFVLSVAAPAFAVGVMHHNVSYDFEDATIDLEKQVGHLCNTGAELKQEVSGDAQNFSKVMNVSMERWMITVAQDDASWVAGDNALTVLSAIKLCAPGKHEYTATEFVYDPWTWQNPATNVPQVTRTAALPGANSWTSSAVLISGEVVEVPHGYQIYDWSSKWIDANGVPFNSKRAMLANWIGWDLAEVAALTDLQVDRLLAVEMGYYQFHELEELTKQEWSVRVTSDPGFSGELSQKWEAAYGPYEAPLSNIATPLGLTRVDWVAWGVGQNQWWMSDAYMDTVDATPDALIDEGFGFRIDDGAIDIAIGDDYVGNRFMMEQFARVSQGTLERFIDISSPWSHAYLSEDMTVTGKAQVQEGFTMVNLTAGADKTTLWHEVF